MNIRKVASLGLAVALQVLPITRVFVASSPAAGSSFAIISTWIAGALALMGTVDAVSGASSLLISPATATTGVSYSGIVQYSGAHASSVKSWELKNNWAGAQSGCNNVYEIAPGLWLTNSGTYLARVGGVPAASGAFNFTLKVWSGSGCTGGDSDTRSSAITVTGGSITAPSIIAQPVSQTVTAGATVSFTVGASGTAPLSYQWRFNGANIGGATSATLTLTGATAGQAGNYDCVVTNAAGIATSGPATLTVNAAVVAPTITTQPASQTITAGANVIFTVGASGTAPLSYQWKLNGANLNGATSATLSLTGVTTGQAGSYTCVVTNSAGSATSSAATLTVNAAPVAPSITTQPVSQTVTAGANVNFAVVAGGTAPLSYQWQLNGTNLSGATSATLSLTGVTLGQAGSYSCVVTNAAGSATSSSAALTVNPAVVAPIITTQPVGQTVTEGANASFTIAASGTSPLSYQWRFNGFNLGGATNATLSLTSVTTNQAGSYACVVTNAAGSVTSVVALLTVTTLPVAPAFITQPLNQTVVVGANANFTVAASGTSPLGYQWQLNGANIPGATSSTISLTSVTTNQAGSYVCVVTNTAGSAISSTATLTVNVPPGITTQPISQNVTAGTNVSFAVAATGTAPLSYQWRLNGANISGAIGATLNLSGVTTNQSGSYACVVTNIAGSITSGAATLTVNAAPAAPTITTQPISQTVSVGANVSLTVSASGTAPLSYQWQKNGANVSGGTGPTLALTSVTTNQAGSYTCVVTNIAGSATSSAAMLSVNPAPIAPSITAQPVSQSVTVGANVSFMVAASGTAPLSYQWRRNGANIAGATATTLSLTSVTTNSSGTYTCVVTNLAGSATSAGASLLVQAVAPPASTLTVIIQGQGTLTPNLNATTLTIGQYYTMTATPAAGYEFGGWSGNVPAVQSSSSALTFVMVSNLVLQASFVPTPYTAGAGNYNGLFFESDAVRLNSAGAFSMHSDPSGNYSGWLQIGYARFSFAGKLDLNLRATNVITRWNGTPVTIELRLGQDAGAGQAFGRVTDGLWDSSLSGGRSTGSSPYAGDYTVVIPGLVGDAHIPAGDGYGTLHVGADGMATMSGTLADGSPFMQSAYVSDDGDWPMYVSLYSAKGALVSWMNFADLAGSDLSGALVWIKQAGASATSYSTGFTNETKAIGSLYTAPTTQGKAVNLSGAVVNFSGGTLTTPINNVVSVNTGSQVVNLSPNQLTFTISTALGTFAGQVAEPGTGTLRTFGGVVLQKQNAGFGFTTGTPVSSRVVLAAP